MDDIATAALPLVEDGEVEVSAKAKRRAFSADYKRRILREADSCSKLGELGALLRREGLYSSHLVSWRRARDRGELAGLTAKKRGPVAKRPDARDKIIVEKDREIRRLTGRAERAEKMLEIQKKVAELMAERFPESGEKS